MRWADVEESLAKAIKVAAGGAHPVHWTKLESAYRPRAYLRLDLVSLVPQGLSERRYLDGKDEETDEPILRQLEATQHALTVQVTASSQSQSLAKSAMALAQRTRSALGLDEVQKEIAKANIAVARTGMIFDTSAPDVEGRSVSEATFEIVFNAPSTVEGEPVQWIEEILVRGEIRNVGTPDSDPPDWEIEQELE